MQTNCAIRRSSGKITRNLETQEYHLPFRRLANDPGRWPLRFADPHGVCTDGGTHRFGRIHQFSFHRILPSSSLRLFAVGVGPEHISQGCAIGNPEVSRLGWAGARNMDVRILCSPAQLFGVVILLTSTPVRAAWRAEYEKEHL